MIGAAHRSSDLPLQVKNALARFNIELRTGPSTDDDIVARTPITGLTLGWTPKTSLPLADEAVSRSCAAFAIWRVTPAPLRGELVRLLAEELRLHKTDLAVLVTLETGKILSEAQGEVQEMIDICDYAVGLSRQLYGRTIASERPGHRMMETWHPLGPAGIITAFNFPVAVWAWNAAVALVCGDPVLWKPSEKTPLTAMAVQKIFHVAADRFGQAPEGLAQMLLGGPDLGEWMADDRRIPLVSATGSTRMGRSLAPKLSARFARSLLELGGNNCAIVCPSADLTLTVRAVAFSAMGTAGQRCTTLRRILVHESIYPVFLERLRAAYESVRVGDPFENGVHVGPLISEDAWLAMQAAMDQSRAIGGHVVGGERVPVHRWPAATYARPALVELREQTGPMMCETFAPVLYALRYSDLRSAIAIQNSVAHGLSSCIFTNDLREAEMFLSAEGSDCGIANVNIGPSGAEIGGAFGGEKDTGGGRESGSDSWKAYMRQCTNTINFSSQLPLAQGVRFDIDDKPD